MECLLKKRAEVNIKDDDGVSIYEAKLPRVDQHCWLEFEVHRHTQIVMYHSTNLASEILVTKKITSYTYVDAL